MTKRSRRPSATRSSSRPSARPRQPRDTLRVAFIGASHLRALLDGWALRRADGTAAPVKASFFGAGFSDMIVRPEGLFWAYAGSAPAPAGDVVHEVRFADYDALVMTGLFAWRSVVNLYHGYRAESHADTAGDICLVSDACFDAAVLAAACSYAGWPVASALGEATTLPFALLPQPRMRADVATQPKLAARFSRLREVGDDACLAASYDRAARRLAGDRFTLIEQPADTLETQLLTRDDYAAGPPFLHKGEASYDGTHMNGAYGRLMLERCMDWAAGAAGRA